VCLSSIISFTIEEQGEPWLMSRGGKRVAEKWGTRVMENEEGTLTAAMVRHLYSSWLTEWFGG